MEEALKSSLISASTSEKFYFTDSPEQDLTGVNTIHTLLL